MWLAGDTDARAAQAGLAAGHRFKEHQLGEDAGELLADLNDAEDESSAQGDRQQQQDQTQHQAPSSATELLSGFRPLAKQQKLFGFKSRAIQGLPGSSSRLRHGV
eukprot:gene12895-13021_t